MEQLTEKTNTKVKVVIADDHSLTLNGIKNVIEQISSIEIIGLAYSGNETLEILKKHQADILITNVEMDNMDGIELAEIVKKRYKSTKVIVVTSHSEPWIIRKLLKFDVKAIVLKSRHSSVELQHAIKAVNLGGRFFSQAIQDSFFKLKVSEQNTPKLTPREKEILILICEEYTIKDIAKELNISTSTVETHRKNLFVKLKVKSQSGIVHEAIRYGFYVFD